MAKYFYVPYTTTDEDDWSATRGMIVRVSNKKDLLKALHDETREGDFPPELAEALERGPFTGGSAEGGEDMTYYLVGTPLDEEDSESVTYILRYGEPEPMDSVEQAMARALQDRVYEPHLYRLDARGGLQPISFGSKSEETSKNPARRRNTHDAGASTDAMLSTLWHGVHSFERAGSAKRDNDRRAALATSQWEFGQAWTHGQYVDLSADDRNEVRVWIYELAMRVHELIADDGKPSKQEIENTKASAEQVTTFVQRSSFAERRVANPKGAR